ncbi:MAG: M28 family peptidase [Gemmatimonadaceae bacterium]
MPCLFRPTIAGLLLLAAADLAAQQRLAPPMSESALRTRLEAYAADSMRGRLTGTADNLKATQYIADELRKAGLEPAGDDGTFFQRVPLVRMVLDTAATRVVAGGAALVPNTNYLPRNQGAGARAFDGASVIYAGVWGAPGLIGGEAVRGKTVVLATPPDNSSVIKLQAQAMFAHAVAIVIANFELMPPPLRQALAGSPMVLDGPGAAAPDLPAYMHITRATAAQILGVDDLAAAVPGREGTPIAGRIAFTKQPVEANNVVAVLRGGDATLRDEYVAVGAHNDHVGVGPPVDRDSLRAFNLELRAKQLAAGGQLTQMLYNSVRVNMDSVRGIHPTPRLDSIYNGADDDGSGSMAVLEVARALAAERSRPRRSIIFVWHTGEELGLFGADHFTRNPTVPRDQIVAQLNLDMVGRGKPGDEVDGGPNYIQLIGSRRLSTQLGDLVERVSREKGFGWAFDYQYDAPGHPEQFYCRSDHYMYARYGIPVVFMSTGGHADYHQVTDEVEYLDFAKLSKVARYTHDLANAVANAASRPFVDKPKPDPDGDCVQ